MKELKELYFKKLEVLWDIEDKLIGAIPDLIEKATNQDLRTGLRAHLEETKEHRDRIETIFMNRDHTSNGQKEASFALMLEETSKELAGIDDPDVRDAAIVAAAQIVEHIEIAKYTTVAKWAKELEDPKSEELLRKTLSEEDGADKKLSGVADGNLFKSGVVAEAAITSHV